MDFIIVTFEAWDFSRFLWLRSACVALILGPCPWLFSHGGASATLPVPRHGRTMRGHKGLALLVAVYAADLRKKGVDFWSCAENELHWHRLRETVRYVAWKPGRLPSAEHFTPLLPLWLSLKTGHDNQSKLTEEAPCPTGEVFFMLLHFLMSQLQQVRKDGSIEMNDLVAALAMLRVRIPSMSAALRSTWPIFGILAVIQQKLLKLGAGASDAPGTPLKDGAAPFSEALLQFASICHEGQVLFQHLTAWLEGEPVPFAAPAPPAAGPSTWTTVALRRTSAMGESDATRGDAETICQEIRRVGGKDRVTYGELMSDPVVQQSLGGTELKEAIAVAQEQGLLTLEGSLDDDAALLVLTADTVEEPPEAVAAEEPVAEEPPAVQEPPVAEEPPAVEEPAAAEAPAEEPPAEPAAVEEPPAEAVEEAPAEKPQSEVVPEPAPAPAEEPSDGGAAAGGEVLSSTTSATVKKTEDGKWKVDTGYIDYRTKDPNNLEPRRGTVLDAAAPAAAVVGQSSRDEDGKFKVDTSYINHRTGEVDRLEGRRSVLGGPDAMMAHSATVKKDDGKWKVDTSYIGHRTGDTDNLTRKEEKQDEEKYADPMTKKYSHDELKASQGRPADVDPARREQYLSDSDFQSLFGMSMADFQKQPKWKQQNAKKSKDLF
eukprot:s726_g8.t1